GNSVAFAFAKGLLPQLHPLQKLGPTFFTDLIDSLSETTGQVAYNVPQFALHELAKFDVNVLDVEFLERLLLNPLTRRTVLAWVNEGRLKARTFPVEFLKVVAYHPDWEQDQWIATLKQSGKEWAKQLTYDEALANAVIEWLKDVRRFTPADLGFDWLMKLVARSEERYHDFAVDTMVRSFAPADFAPKAAPAVAPSPLPSPPGGERRVRAP